MHVTASMLLLGTLAVTAAAQQPSAKGASQEPKLDALIAQSAKGLNFYSLERERKLGSQATATLERTLPIVNEPKLDAYIAQVGAMLAKAAASQFVYTFTVYEDRRQLKQTQQADLTSPAVAAAVMPMDAFQVPAGEPVAVAGGPIFIPLSSLAAAPNEAVFAFQLAHAMAHVALRHATKQATRTELAGVDASSGQFTTIADRRLTQFPLGMLQFARAFERQADYVALRIVSQSGYSPQAMADYLSGLPAPGRAVFSAHPPPSERSRDIRAKSERLPATAYTTATGGFTEARAIAATVR